MRLEGLTAIVVGASGKLGGQIAAGLAQKGVCCVCHYQANKAKAERAVKRILRRGGCAVAIQADIARESDIENLFDAAEKHFRAPQIVIDCASVFARQPILELDHRALWQTLAVNLAAPMLLAKWFARKIADAKPRGVKKIEPRGKLIFLIDTAAARPWAGFAPYCAAGAGVAALTACLAKELAPNIAVNALALGIIDMPENAFSAQDRQKQLDRIPLGRFGKPSEIVHAAMFLLENDYITGQTLVADGGRML